MVPTRRRRSRRLYVPVRHHMSYPRWFILKLRHNIPVVLRTRDVGRDAYNLLFDNDRVMPVSPLAHWVAEDIDRLQMIDPTYASQVILCLWDICDPEIPHLQPSDAYMHCLYHIATCIVEDEFEGMDGSRNVI